VGQDINAPGTRAQHRKQRESCCDGDPDTARLTGLSLPPYDTKGSDYSDDAKYRGRSTYS
jgi:hypothetical protein